MIHKFEIDAPFGGPATIKLDGRPLEGVTTLRLNLSAQQHGIPTLTLVITGYIVVNGEYQIDDNDTPQDLVRV